MENKKNKFSKWLELLQQESWQLELLISGIALVILANAWQPLENLMYKTELLTYEIMRSFIFAIPFSVLLSGWYFLFINLVFHILFRGLWIATVGLRYISHDIDYEELGYSEKFKMFLSKRIGSFDDYIERLEKLCSIIFAFTFLILFAFLSLGIYMFLIGLLGNTVSYISKIWLNNSRLFGAIFQIPFLLFGLLYFIDFITLGFFKRKKWAAKWYLPIYRMMSVLTLSFIYRPMYHNLIDNKYGRRFGYLLVPYMAFMFLLTTLQLNTHPYFAEENQQHLSINTVNYLDWLEEGDNIVNPLISSRFVEDGFLEVFIPYLPVLDDFGIAAQCDDFKPEKTVGLSIKASDMSENEGGIVRENKLTEADTTLQCLINQIHLYIDDSLVQQVDYQLLEHPNHGERGLHTVINVADFSREKHVLRIEKYRPRMRALVRIDMKWREVAHIPFWVK